MNSPDPSDQPYWWTTQALPELPEATPPGRVDVAIVGAGYTGLSAAITLARAGQSVAVLDRMRPGEGASTRNGGITSGNLRLSLAQMTRRFGPERAQAILEESRFAREDLYRFLSEEKLECDFALTGRFGGALTPADADRLARDADALRERFGIEAHPVSRAEVRAYIGTDLYCGGNVRMDIGGLNPAKLHAGMLRLALDTGATVHPRTAVQGLEQRGDGHVLATSRGQVTARHVMMGTNGYTDGADRWLRRRLVPVRSRIIATAELPADMMQRLVPKRMMLGDTRKLSYYYRPSPDGRRILFGGRDGATSGDPGWSTAHLRRELVRIWPELSDVPISHSWYGHVAMNRDMVPRIFSHSGRRYATGYCGSGVVWARWAGQKVAWQILGGDAGESALDFRAPAAVPFFNGYAWFMPGVYAWLSAQDRFRLGSGARRTGTAG
ncbi:FAD-binding oxidoreductase [Pararhodobacter sp. SW119]|uniref:NAD(P)/FAD-dependent oxidoreductase n=1 Tax=Pararhodobacter sp. SW119 TaxID=2780075 RepID=UPI001ADFA7CA|nr:FAD-binding oxidoreductase [Pararhodobacter sp. SW119]